MKGTFKRLCAALLILCMVFSMLPVMASAASYDRTIAGPATIGTDETTALYSISYDTATYTITLTAPDNAGGMDFVDWDSSVRFKMTGLSAYIDAEMTTSGNTATLVLTDPDQQDLAKNAFGNDTYWGKTKPKEIVGGANFATYYNLTVNGGSGSETGILKGSVRTLPTAPDAPEDGKYFIGWSDGSLIYAAGATIVMDREISVSPYYVDKDERFLAIFVDMDGVVYDVQTSDAEGYVSAPATDPTSEKFTFNNWDTDLTAPLTGDTVIRAQGTKKTYGISTDVIASGTATVTVDAAASVDSYVEFSVIPAEGYEVAAVVAKTDSGVIVPVAAFGDYAFTMPTDNVTIYAYTNETIPTYNVRFEADGYLVAEYDLPEGAEIHAPEVPQKEGYTGGTWGTVAEKMGTSDLVYTATYTPRSYRVIYSFTIDGSPKSLTHNVTYGSSYEVANYTGDVPDGQNFLGWSGDNGNFYFAGKSYTWKTAATTRMKPVFEGDTEYWTVKFVGEDGDLYDVALVEKTEDAVVTMPTYEPYPDALWTLDNPDGIVEYNADIPVAITGDTTFTVKAPALFTVTFKANGYQVAQYTVRDGETLTEIPAVPETYGYYGKWDTDLTQPITGDLTVTAKYKAVTCYIQYRLTEAQETTVSVQPVDFGSYFRPIDYTWDVPDGQSFLAWRGKDGNLYVPGLSYLMKNTNPLVVTPLFENNTEYWTVKFMGENGYLYDVALVEKTSDATVTLPTYAEYPAATWVLDGTEYNADDTADITGDTTFTVKAPALYTVTFMANGYQVAQYAVRDGETLPEVPAVPEKYGYTGAWDADTTAAITADTVIEADYTANEYHLYFDSNSAPNDDLTVAYGDWFTVPDYEGEVPDGMKFLGWNGDDGQFFLVGELQRLSVASDLYLLPVFASDTEYWTVKFCHPDGSLENVYLVEQAAEAGTEFFVDDKEYSLYPDAEWMLTSGDVDGLAVGETVSTNYITVRSDVVFTAVVPDTYTILFCSEEGYLMDARFIMENELIGAGPVAPAKEGYTFVGWQDENGDLLDDTTVATQDMTYRPVYEANTYPITLVPSEHVALGVIPESAEASVGDIITIGTAAEEGFETYYVCVYYQNAAGKMVPVAISPLPANDPYDTPDMNGYTFVMPAGPVAVQVVEQANRNTAKFIVDDAIYGFEYILSGETPTAPVEPVKEGYTFIGWKALSTGTEYPVGSEFDPIYADETYVALFEINTYDLTYYRGVEADESEYKCFLTLPDGLVVEFFNNDVTDMPTYKLTGFEYGTKVVLGEPSLPGYVFQYWLDEDGGIHLAGSNFEMKADAYLTAIWKVDTELSCFVSFNTEDGIYRGFLAYDGQDASIPETDPVKDGYVFKGWEYDGNVYSNSGVKDFTVAADEDRMMIFNAVWEEITYTVTLNDTMNPVETIAPLYNGDEYVLPAAPDKEGFTFVAWMDQANGAYYMENAKLYIDRDYDFIAVWSEDSVEYAVKFYNEENNLIDIFVVPANSYMDAPYYTEGRDDCSYVWVDYDNGRWAAEGDEILVDGDLNFYAEMTEESEYGVNVIVTPDDAGLTYNLSQSTYQMGESVLMTINIPEGYVLKAVESVAITASGKAVPLVSSLLTFSEDGSVYGYLFTMPAGEVLINIILEEIPVGSTVVKFINDGDLYDYVIVEKGTNGTAPAVAPSKPGYTFDKWYSESGFVGAGGTFAVASDAEDEIIYNAVYSQQFYKVHFNLDGGMPDFADIENVAYGETVTLAAEPTKAGYVFVGWREDATGIVYGADGNYVVYADADFTAVWEAAECIVRFVDPDTGILYGYEPISEGKSVTAPAAVVAEGKTFLYWENKENAADRVFAGSLTPSIVVDTTYYARFEASKHNIAVVTDRCDVSLNVTGAVAVGTAVQFTVTPNSDCAVDSVVLTYTDGLSPVVRELHPDASGIYTFVMPDADVTITAKAVQNVFSVFTNPDANTLITVGSNKAQAGETVAFTAEPNNSDYVLNEVYVLTASGAPIALSIVDGKYVFTMPAEDVTITATSVKAELTVTYLDSDNTLLGIVPVDSGDFASAPVASKDGYTFDHWQVLPLTDPEVDFDPATDKVTESLIVRAVYVGNPHTVEAGLVEHVFELKAECTISSGNVNSSNLLLNKLDAETGKDVYFTVAADYDYVITGVAIVGLDGSKTIIEPTLRLKETIDGINYYTVTFPMPAEDVKIDVYTIAKMFRVDVEENLPFAGEYTLNGFYTNNLMIPQGDKVTIDIAPIPGYEVVDVSGTFFDGISVVSLVDYSLSEDKTMFTFPMVAKDVHVSITYAPIDYAIDIETSNFETYKPDSSVNPAVVVESLDPDLTSQGRIELIPYTERDYTNALSQVYKIPANGTANVDNRIYFKVVEYTGYDLDTLTVYFDGFEQTCPYTQLSDGSYCFDMPADDVVIIATFVEETYKVTKDAASEAHGQVELNGLIENSIAADYKDEVTVTVTPDDGYQVSKIYYVLADGSVKDFDAASYVNATVMSDVLDSEQSIVFHMPASDVKVYVEYLAIDYTVSDITMEAVTTYTTPHNVGDQVNFHVEANYGYTIEKVYVVNDTTGERIDRFTDDINGTYGADYYFTMPASSVTIHVDTIKDIYNVEYRDNGDLIGGEQIPYLETANVNDFTPLVDEGRPGYHFVGWTSKDTETPVVTPSNDNADFVIVKDTTIIAAYDKDEIDVHFLATVNGTVTELSTGNTAEYVLDTTVFGDTVKFTAEPDVGYVIDTVRVYTTNSDGYVLDLSCTVSGNEYTFIIPATFKADIHDVQAADVIVSVTFKKDTFTLTKADDCETDGQISVNGSVATETSFEYLYQDTVTIVATPDAGYYVASIVAVNEDGSVKFEQIGAVPAVDTPAGDPVTLTFAMPACDLTYKVDYEKIDYSITCVYDATQGKAETDLTPTAQLDDIVTITVTPEPGYELQELTVTYAGGEKSCLLTQIAENVYTFTMPADAVTVTAIFTEITYIANLELIGEGDATLNGYYTDNMTADYLSTVTINVMPDAGWELTSIVVDGGAITVNEPIAPAGGNYTFTMPDHDVDIVVTLVKSDYDVSAFALNFFEDGHGTVTLSPAEIAHVGDNVIITADPDDGYRVKEVVVLDALGYAVPVSCLSVGGDPDYVETWSFTMPASNVEIYVTFEVQGSSYYDDVRTDQWYYNAVTFVTDRGYFFGVETNLFGPYINMNRAMFVTVLGRMSGVDTSLYTGQAFSDVDTGDYYAPYVQWAADNGIVLGRTATTFDPNAFITREEMAAIMYRYCEYLGMDMTLKNQVFMDRYTDKGDISDWALEYVKWAVGVGLMRGKSPYTINPLENATRAEVAQVIMNLCDKVIYP